MNPAIGALMLRVLTLNAELALIIPTPFELFTGMNVIFLDNPVSLARILTFSIEFPAIVAFNCIAVFPIAITSGDEV